MRSLLLLLCVVPAVGHAMWLILGEKEIAVRFSESATTTSRPGFDKALKSRTAATVALKPATATSPFVLAMNPDGDYYDLIAPTPSSLRDPAAVGLVEGNGLKGIFTRRATARPE